MAEQGGDIQEVESCSAIKGPVTLDKWCSAIEGKIDQPPVEQRIPASHRMVDAVRSHEHPYPSIFRLQGQCNTVAISAIGPYHRAPPAQPIINDDKKRDIVRYLASEQGLNKREFLLWVVNNQEKILRCYENDSVNMAADELAMMLLLDGCFVVLAILHLRSGRHRDRRVSDLADKDRGSVEFVKVSADIAIHMKGLMLDMLMLDNQIPFFVVEELYSQLRTTLFRGINESIGAMSLSCFDAIHPRRSHARASSALPTTVHHLLHLFHWSRIPSNKYMVQISWFSSKEPMAHLPSATELRESATLFWRSSSGSSVDVSFQHNWMRAAGIRIPAVYICDYSESIFRNLIAFEQSHIRCSLSVTAFSICMTRLLQSEADAKILRKNKILVYTEKTDQEIVDFFRGLRDGYQNTRLPKDLMEMYKDVVRHHESLLGRITGGVMLQYFPNRWIIISVACAAILFLFKVAYDMHNLYRNYHPLRH